MELDIEEPELQRLLEQAEKELINAKIEAQQVELPFNEAFESTLEASMAFSTGQETVMTVPLNEPIDEEVEVEMAFSQAEESAHS